MADKIQIYITDENGEHRTDLYRYTDFDISYDIDTVCPTFSITVLDPEMRIKVGYYATFYVNSELILNGLIQKIMKSVNKNGITVRLMGKSSALLLVEQYCRTLNDFYNKTPKYIVETLIAQTKFLSESKIIPTPEFYSDADAEDDSLTDFGTVLFVNKSNRTFTSLNKVTYDTAFEGLSAYPEFTINAGDTVWDKITEIVTINGYQAYFKNAQELIIGRLKTERDNAKLNFKLLNKINNSNVLSAELDEDISDRYTEIQVSTQLQNGRNITKKILDQTAPIEKYMLMTVANDQDPESIGIETREMQRIEGYQLNYTVRGFTQNKNLWKVNRFVKVEDEFLDINDTYVIYKVEFNCNKDNGLLTNLVISKEKDLVNTTYPPGTISGIKIKT